MLVLSSKPGGVGGWGGPVSTQPDGVTYKARAEASECNLPSWCLDLGLLRLQNFET